MASFERKIIESHEQAARNICDFLYVDGKGKKGFQSHTENEYRDFLKELAADEFSIYNDAAKEKGWI